MNPSSNHFNSRLFIKQPKDTRFLLHNLSLCVLRDLYWTLSMASFANKKQKKWVTVMQSNDETAKAKEEKMNYKYNKRRQQHWDIHGSTRIKWDNSGTRQCQATWNSNKQDKNKFHTYQYQRLDVCESNFWVFDACIE